MNNYQLTIINAKNRKPLSLLSPTLLALVHCSLFICFIISGCYNPLSPPPLQIPSGMGSFSLSVDGARTILPNTTIDSFKVYTLVFTGAETVSEDRTNTTLSAPKNLKAGTYSLTVTAYMDTAKTMPAASGSLSGIKITEGETTTCTISLTPLGMTTGKGTFSWDINFPGGLSAASMKITPVNTATGTAEQTLYFTGGSPQVNKNNSVELNSGVYRVVFTLIKNSSTQTVTWRDAVHVYQNMTSAFSYTFTEAHFNNIKYAVTFVYNDEAASDLTVDRLHGAVASAPASPFRTNYIFDGWYADNGSFLNEWVFSTPLTGDITLYAKWLPFTVSSEAEWNRVVSAINSGGNNKEYVITVTGDFSLAGRTVSTFNPTGLTVNIYGGKTISLSGAGSLLRINTSQTIVMHEVTLKGLAANTASLVYINGGTFTMNSGEISGNTSTSGGGVYVSSGTFTMNGGEISGNTSSTSGGGVYISTTGTFTKSGGGTIYGYNASDPDNALWNVVKNSSGAVQSNRGHAVYWDGVSYLDATQNAGDNISFEILDAGWKNAAALTANTWAGGNIPLSTGEQWFKFTATANTQYLHVSFGTLTSLYFQVYDSSFNTVRSRTQLSSGTRYTSLTVTAGQEYYVRVWPYSDSSGTYRIAFSRSSFTPGADVAAIALSADTWANGDIPLSTGEQCFKFTATADTQYLHVGFDTLSDLYIQVYDSNLNAVGSQINLYGSTRYVSRTASAGQEYYVLVWPYSSYNSGTYKIAFNTTLFPPGTASVMTGLTVGVWADGNIPLSTGEQWFKFTATANTQFLHVGFDTLSNLYIQVYDSSFNAVGSRINLYGSTKYTSLTASAGQEYYVQVLPSSGSGTYRIAFSRTSFTPGADVTATALAAAVWSDGNIPSSAGEQWFKFTATAKTQYLHLSFGTLADLYIQAYDSSFNTVGSQTPPLSSTSSTRYASLTANAGQDYYVKVWPSSGSGTYRITFSHTSFTPGADAEAIALSADTWADGDIPQYYGEQYFKFTATAATQFIHVSFGTLADLYIQVYDSGFNAVGSQTNLYGSTRYASLTASAGQDYYVKVLPYSYYSGGGAYKITFNAMPFSPDAGMTITTLSIGVWANGNIPSAAGEQWFKFTATAAAQFIHVSFGTLTSLNFQVYDSSLKEVGSQTQLSSAGSAKYVSRTVSAGQDYYVRVLPSSGNGTYRMAFNASAAPPP